MEKVKILSLIVLLSTLLGCQGNVSEGESTPLETEDVNLSTDEISSEEESDDTVYTTFVDLQEVNIEVGERYSLKTALANYKGVTITSKNIKVASYGTSKSAIIGKGVGTTYLVLNYKGENQKLKVNVYEQGTFSSSFAFDYFRLEGKKIAAFGDSVTADSTIGNSGKTYPRLIAERFNMEFTKNYAIGGTTATYMYVGSNIYKEYKNNKTAIDGCRVVYNAFANDELSDLDYAFIAYGHNDQYFQPPITIENDDVYCVDSTFASCNSYKGSYRYMINVLREANPNVRIILLNCTYSEYDKNLISPYGNKYSYSDYRKATQEIAEEMNCRYIDPWDYMKDYFDFGKSYTYYSDSVHISAKGHQLLANYIIQN